jgi:hypothetical protein
MSIYKDTKVCENVYEEKSKYLKFCNSDGEDGLFKNISLLFASFFWVVSFRIQLLNTYCPMPICTFQTIRTPTVFEKKTSNYFK